MIFDAHRHTWRRWPYTADLPDPATRGDAGHLLSMMDRHGVDRALVVAAGIGAGDPTTDNTDTDTDVAVAVAGSAGRLVWVADVGSRGSPDYRRAVGAERVRVALTDRPWGGTAQGSRTTGPMRSTTDSTPPRETASSTRWANGCCRCTCPRYGTPRSSRSHAGTPRR